MSRGILSAPRIEQGRLLPLETVQGPAVVGDRLVVLGLRLAPGPDCARNTQLVAQAFDILCGCRVVLEVLPDLALVGVPLRGVSVWGRKKKATESEGTYLTLS